jgi:hypothetical protein
MGFKYLKNIRNTLQPKTYTGDLFFTSLPRCCKYRVPFTTKTVRSNKTHGGTGQGWRLGVWGRLAAEHRRRRRSGALSGRAVGGIDGRGRSTAERSKASATGSARRWSGRRRQRPGVLGGGAAGAGRRRSSRGGGRGRQEA